MKTSNGIGTLLWSANQSLDPRLYTNRPKTWRFQKAQDKTVISARLDRHGKSLSRGMAPQALFRNDDNV
jgi:hypothetical protein